MRIFFGGHDKIGRVLGVFSMYFRVFSKGKSTEREYFCVAKKKNITSGSFLKVKVQKENIFAWQKNKYFLGGCLIFPIFLAANGKCWAQSYV